MKERHLPVRLNLVDLAEHGFWFCRSCRRVTDLNLDGPVNACVLCGSSDVQWREPVFGSEPDERNHEREREESEVRLDAAMVAWA